MIARLLAALFVALSSFPLLRRAVRRRLQRLPRRDVARGAGGRRLARRDRPGVRRRHLDPRCSPSTAASAAPSARPSRNMSRPASAPPASSAASRCCEARSLLARVEQQFGPPKELIVAIWGLESDYGTGDMGKLPVVRTIATMAHDCRRTELFQGELLAALQDLAARRSDARDHDRRLCRGDGPDPVPAVVLSQVWRRLRRQRPRRPAPQRPGRARLHGQPAQGQRLEARRAVQRGHGEFPGDARVEPERAVPQDDALFAQQLGAR